VSTSKNDINYVVTEFGVAQLRGKTAKQRCAELIGIAHLWSRIFAVNCAKRRKR
jgi:acyl-CoA hydrolase